MAKKNSYQKKAQKKQFLDGISVEQAKGDYKKSALKTGRDILLSAVGGGLAGAVLGRASLLAGIAVTGVGHYMGSDGTASFGVGMMASGSYQAIAGLSGAEQDGFEGVKERVLAFKDDIKHRLFLDKLFPATAKKTEKEEDKGTNGMGDVQYFTYPNGKELEGAEDIDLSALDRIEKQVEASAKKYKAAKEESFSGSEEANGMMDINEQNF
jgi:hypothetical protein